MSSKQGRKESRKIESLQHEVLLLKQRFDNQQNESHTLPRPSAAPVSDGSPSNSLDFRTTASGQSPTLQQNLPSLSRKRTRSQFEVEDGCVPNFVAKGLVSTEQAELFFEAFFQGCDRFVTIFDPLHDSFQSITARSSFLLDAIITVGSSVVDDTNPSLSTVLHFQLKKMVNLVIINQEHACLETVQALLIIACYSAERSLILAFATRMAVDIGLPDAYEELTRRLVNTDTADISDDSTLDDAALMRRARAWFQLMVLEQILRVDAGNIRAFQLRGKARRCRILLNQPFSTVLDLRLLSQVELNALRAKYHESLSMCSKGDTDEVMSTVRDAQIDIDIWFDDWQSIMKRVPVKETPVLLLNLEIQQYWAKVVVLCRAIRVLGIENISEMSDSQRHLLSTAKVSLKKHLRVILDQPQNYLAHFRYAMDFVWAKAAYCFLLLLKLARLLPEDDAAFNLQLLNDGYALLSQLNKAGGGSSSGGGRSQTSRMYLQVLQTSVQKFARAVQEDPMNAQTLPIEQSSMATTDSASPFNFFWSGSSYNTQQEIDSFVPEQFVFEWDFPGLTLFSSSGVGDSFLEEFLLGPNVDTDSWFLGAPG
ncbi:hypothetical protein PV08_03221 [Exophiala spinifera]|uniref:Transcription factor domain-containing protein n=1 Tax=Exophiala spinifera TaxID=91928 RepID=A0A0D2A1W7_9EURO|nr:uncharacterized protein PV08_03221 [Exophiala spinifera]KIW18932.1 hypothetical protein PV08_03221 [Exophiala spinifera]